MVSEVSDCATIGSYCGSGSDGRRMPDSGNSRTRSEHRGDGDLDDSRWIASRPCFVVHRDRMVPAPARAHS